MRRTLMLAALLGSTALAPSIATAEDGPAWASKTGAVGVGADTTLNDSNGIHVRYLVIPDLEIGGTVGFNMLSIEDFSTTELALGVYAGYRLASSERAALAGLVGIDIQNVSFDDGTTDDSATDFLIGLGVQAEYFPTQYLSLFVQTGLAIDILTETELEGGEPTMSDSGLSLGLGSDLWGGAGFTVWFK